MVMGLNTDRCAKKWDRVWQGLSASALVSAGSAVSNANSCGALRISTAKCKWLTMYLFISSWDRCIYVGGIGDTCYTVQLFAVPSSMHFLYYSDVVWCSGNLRLAHRAFDLSSCRYEIQPRRYGSLGPVHGSATWPGHWRCQVCQGWSIPSACWNGLPSWFWSLELQSTSSHPTCQIPKSQKE